MMIFANLTGRMLSVRFLRFLCRPRYSLMPKTIKGALGTLFLLFVAKELGTLCPAHLRMSKP
ncbi:hypothetical protein, partial [Pseudomonas syringae]|uniref:hypothetical protein n=1 Tax=Pseudomonas syringae TaxID=317 RepID=UPI001F2ADC50